jgi:hypothetical protein
VKDQIALLIVLMLLANIIFDYLILTKIDLLLLQILGN